MSSGRRERGGARRGPGGRQPRRKPRKETLEILAANVRAFRQAAEWSQERLADEAGLQRSYIGDVERCQQNPGLATLEALADALRVLIGDLTDPPPARMKRRSHRKSAD